MTVTLYRSSDASAPVLTGQLGSLITVLDAWVAGYGTKPASGWSKAFAGVNLAAYRGGTGQRYFLKVRDDGPGLGGAQEARIRGFETMTQVTATDTAADGTNPAPTIVQTATGTFVRKSATLDATARPWIILSDDRTLYMFVRTGDNPAWYMTWGFGEIFSRKGVGDLGRTFIHGRTTENTGGAVSESFDVGAFLGTDNTSFWLFRDTANNVGAITAGKMGDGGVGHANGGVNAGVLAFTNPPDNVIYSTPVRVIHIAGGNQIRGRLRGLLWTAHAISNYADGDTLTGSGDFVGKTFLIVKQTPNGGLYVLETTTTWETN